jgi:hypothetical protein
VEGEVDTLLVAVDEDINVNFLPWDVSKEMQFPTLGRLKRNVILEIREGLWFRCNSK